MHMCFIEELCAVFYFAYHGTTTDRKGRPPISQSALQYPRHELLKIDIVFEVVDALVLGTVIRGVVVTVGVVWKLML